MNQEEQEVQAQKIKALAKELAKGKDTFSRADLAFELKMPDSIEVERLVWETYIKDNRNKEIENAFLSNDGVATLVDSYKLSAWLAENNSNEAFEVVNEDLHKATDRLNELQKQISTYENEPLSAKASKSQIFLPGQVV